MIVTNIKWDTDGNQTIFDNLPKVVKIPDHIPKDSIGDYLSDLTGFCHFGFTEIDRPEPIEYTARELETKLNTMGWQIKIVPDKTPEKTIDPDDKDDLQPIVDIQAISKMANALDSVNDLCRLFTKIPMHELEDTIANEIDDAFYCMFRRLLALTFDIPEEIVMDSDEYLDVTVKLHNELAESERLVRDMICDFIKLAKINGWIHKDIDPIFV